MTEQTRTINHSLTVNAPLETVFRAFTVADDMASWWPSAVESDPRPGGKFKYTFENIAPSDPIQFREGVYLDVKPDQQVRFPWIIPGMEPSTTVNVQLTAADGGTTVNLAHTGWPTVAEMDEVFQMHDMGWQAFLNNLKIVLEGGQDIRPSKMGMKTVASH